MSSAHICHVFKMVFAQQQLIQIFIHRWRYTHFTFLYVCKRVFCDLTFYDH